MEQFTQLTRRAFAQFVNDQVNDRLKSALEVTTAVPSETSNLSVSDSTENAENPKEAEPADVVTTAEELEAYYIVRSILRGTIDVKRVSLRDVQSYCGIILDDNRFKPICRLYFNRAQKYLALFDGQTESRVPITDLDSIYEYAERLKLTAASYPPPKSKAAKPSTG